MRTIYIAGAGISGLTLALALAKCGLRTVILERNKSISEFGAGLQISPNARLCLNRLGLNEALEASSFKPDAIDIYTEKSQTPFSSLTLGPQIAQHFGSPYSVMHRADLAEILYESTKRFANVEVIFGIDSFSVEKESGSYLVEALEPDGKMRRAKAFAFVGADGVRSHTRTSMLNGPHAQFSGKVAWRATLPPGPLARLIDLKRVSVIMDKNYHMVIYPLPHHNAVNIAVFTNENIKDLQNLTENSLPNMQPKSNARVRDIVKLVGNNWTPWILSTIKAPSWHSDGIGIIGDAAHAMLPFQAQGAAMGIEDAAVLAPLLAASPNAEHAFMRFEALRRSRIEQVQKLSEQNGNIFHMGFPMAQARNAVMKLQGPLAHFKRLDWLYGYDAQKVSDT